MITSSSALPGIGQATAGFLNTDWNPRDVPAGTVTRKWGVRSPDGAATSGSLYLPPGGHAKAVVSIMHPREFMACHYLIPDILAAGYAAWSQSPRSIGGDLRLEHETALIDGATGLNFLVDTVGMDRIILLGNSGGASLYAFYVQQASLAPEQRIARTPGGRKCDLADLVMPKPSGMILVAPHPGQGMLLMGCIDPSVPDESDPFSVDPSLDPLDPANGFRPAPQSSSYSETFVTRYRAAQQERVARLDAVARRLIAEKLDARKRGKDSDDIDLKRRGAHSAVMTVWRTDADLRCFDLSIDPSDRK